MSPRRSDRMFSAESKSADIVTGGNEGILKTSPKKLFKSISESPKNIFSNSNASRSLLNNGGKRPS